MNEKKRKEIKKEGIKRMKRKEKRGKKNILKEWKGKKVKEKRRY